MLINEVNGAFVRPPGGKEEDERKGNEEGKEEAEEEVEKG